MRFLKLLFAIALVFNLSSCTLTENITVNEDGTGKFSIDMDASALMGMIPRDSLKAEKSMDSTFTFKEIFESKRDSIAKLPLDEQEKLKKLSDFSIRMKMDYQTQDFLFSMGTDFKSVTDLQDAMTLMNSMQNASTKKSDINPLSGLGGVGNNNSELRYTYNGKKFTRKAKVSKKEISAAEKDSAEAYKMVYESSTYVIKYHFPKPVKKVSNPNALFSEDRKTITIEYPFNEYMSDPEKLNFEVEF